MTITEDGNKNTFMLLRKDRRFSVNRDNKLLLIVNKTPSLIIFSSAKETRKQPLIMLDMAAPNAGVV